MDYAWSTLLLTYFIIALAIYGFVHWIEVILGKQMELKHK